MSRPILPFEQTDSVFIPALPTAACNRQVPTLTPIDGIIEAADGLLGIAGPGAQVQGVVRLPTSAATPVDAAAHHCIVAAARLGRVPVSLTKSRQVTICPDRVTLIVPGNPPLNQFLARGPMGYRLRSGVENP